MVNHIFGCGFNFNIKIAVNAPTFCIEVKIYVDITNTNHFMKALSSMLTFNSDKAMILPRNSGHPVKQVNLQTEVNHEQSSNPQEVYP